MSSLTKLVESFNYNKEGPHPCRTCRHWISDRCQHNPTLNGHGNLCDHCTFWEKRGK